MRCIIVKESNFGLLYPLIGFRRFSKLRFGKIVEVFRAVEIIKDFSAVREIFFDAVPYPIGTITYKTKADFIQRDNIPWPIPRSFSTLEQLLPVFVSN